LGRQGLWIDEMCCWNDAKSSFQRIFSTFHDVVFLLEKFSLHLGGDHEYFLRLPSAFGGLLGLIFIFPLGYILFDDKKAALYALILLAFSPINIYYSQDANYYGLMMGFTVASLYFLFLFMKNHNPLWLIFYGITIYINYYVHLANILLIACQLVTLGAFIVLDGGFRRRIISLFKKITQNKAAFVLSGAAALVIMGYGGYRFFRFIYRMAIRPYGTVLAENFEFSPRFFLKLAMDYGVAFQQYSPGILALTAVVIILFLWGMAYSFRKNRFFALFVFLSWTLPFLAIYIKKIGHFYHCRYTSFIVPGYLLLTAAGIRRIEEFLRSKARDKIAKTSVLAIFGILSVGMVPNLWRYYTGHKQDWKGAVAYLKNNLESGEKVTSNLFCNDSSLRFYFQRLSMDEKPIIKLAGEFRGAPYSGLFRLKKLCFLEPGVYFAISYTRYEDQRMWNWVKAHFNEVFHRPSLHPEEFNREGKEVILYKFKYSGAFVFPPYAYHHDCDPPADWKAGFDKEILFGAKGQFRIVFECENISGDGEYRITAKMPGGGETSENALVSREGERNFLTAILDLKEGPHVLSLDTSGSPVEKGKIVRISIYPEISGVYHREAEDTDMYHPTVWKRIENIKGALCFTLERSNYVYYDRIPFTEEGRYGIRIRVLEDKPGPVTLEASLDWNPVGVFVLSKGDNAWTDCQFPLEVLPGDHTLSFHFLSPPRDVDKLISGKMPSDRDQDTDLHLDYFEIKPLKADENFPDTRFNPRIPVVRKPSHWPDGFENPHKRGSLASGWQLNPPHEIVFGFEKEATRENAVGVVVPYDSKGLTLISPLIPVKPNEIFYFSAWLRVQGMANHTANMRALYLDQNNQSIKGEIVNADGITGDTDWIRQAYMRQAPPGAVRAVLLYWIYPNSRRPSTSKGVCYIDYPRFERFPEGL
ncbi:glycosyltransferase family 39 protein, partial [Candidatus Sumerlaeota bacterium]|nr:glycosyltransferase family 39 protein [Candidatus Sumerlaeota bacterium]